MVFRVLKDVCIWSEITSTCDWMSDYKNALLERVDGLESVGIGVLHLFRG